VAWSEGDETALERLMPVVHNELRRLARRYRAGERQGHTLQATALVNEAYLRLIQVKKVRWQNRAHFFAMSARLMRRILVDFARSKLYKKRGGGELRVTLVRGRVRRSLSDEPVPRVDDRATDHDRPQLGRGVEEGVVKTSTDSITLSLR